jgi:hypothetical protein
MKSIAKNQRIINKAGNLRIIDKIKVLLAQ